MAGSKRRSGSKRKRGKGSGAKTAQAAAGGAAAAQAAPVEAVPAVSTPVVDVPASSEAPAPAAQVVAAEPSPAPAAVKAEPAAPAAAAADAAPTDAPKGNQGKKNKKGGKKAAQQSAAGAEAGGAPKAGKGGKKGGGGGGKKGGVTDLWKAKDEKVMPWLDHRLSMFEDLYAKQTEEYKQKQHAITVELPDGTQVEATAFVDTPGNLLKAWNTELLKTAVISKVAPLADKPAAFEDGEDGCWDLMRPLEFDCAIAFYTFDSEAGRHTFWHSSAHILGQSLERIYGGRLTTGPALEDSFYYDADTENTISSVDFKDIETMAKRIGKEKQPFQRLMVSKDVALSMFKFNPFKVKIVEKNIPDGGVASVYRCGPLIDLCTGPHLPNTQLVKSFRVTKNSSAYFQNSADNPSLQRVYGVSFPDKARLDLWAERMRLAQENDHRLVGQRQELYFFHDLSPGSCFWLPHGARLYNKLLAHMREQYWKRGYSEVISPNIYNFKLWETSGHAAKYAENMFQFEVEKAKFAMKPMNCPGHCLMFQHVPMTYKKLPLRMADFGVLHRNELSGALSGLTRVRRFQQDDAHIFCRMDQVSDEVQGCLEFMRDTYAIFGFAYKLKLSTRPETFMGDPADWDTAEQALKTALQGFAGDDWTVNPGDGAFYGPKIDIEVFDALERGFQCATVQLDFQLPKNFDLKYKTDSGDFERPVMVHRAILGSVERFVAILAEHCGGKWPFWVAPRQVVVLPITTDCTPYANLVAQRLHDAGYYADVDESNRRIPKMILEAGGKYNFIAVVGRTEVEEGTVNLRARGEGRSQQGVQLGTVSVEALLEYFDVIRDAKTKEEDVLDAFEPFSSVSGGIAGNLVLKCNADDHRALAVRAAAKLGRVTTLEFQETFDCSFELETPEGNFTSPAAVLRLLVSAGKPSADLVGGPTPMGEALVDQWVDVAYGDLCAAVDPIVFPLRGWAEFSADAYKHAFSSLLRQLAQLNSHLESRTFLASERLSVGDVAMASVLLPVFQYVLAPAMRDGKALVNVTRWMGTVIRVPEFQAVTGVVEFCEKPVPVGSKIVS